MANVTGTFTPYIRDNVKQIIDITGNKHKVQFEFSADISLTGDASGGYVQGRLDLGPLNSKCFYLITDLHSYCSDNIDCYIGISTPGWQNFKNLQLGTLGIGTQENPGAGLFNLIRDKLNSPVYLGLPVYYNATSHGSLIFYWPTNTDGKVYTAFIQGYALKDSLPLSNLTQNSII